MHKFSGKFFLFIFVFGISAFVQIEKAEASSISHRSFSQTDIRFFGLSDHLAVASGTHGIIDSQKSIHLNFHWYVIPEPYPFHILSQKQNLDGSLKLFISIKTFLFRTGLSPPSI
jgi:hypothetical protein